MPGSFSVHIPGHAELHLTSRSGNITVIAEERADVVAEEGASSRGPETDATGRVSIAAGKGGSASMVVRCPAGTDLAVGTISGNVSLQGQFGAVRVTTVSARVEVDRADELDVRSISGDIAVERCTVQCVLHTKSGKTLIGVARNARVSTISGRIHIDATSGTVHAQTVSGNVELGTQRDGDVSVQTMSGSVRVEVPANVRPHTKLRSLSSRPKLECEEGDDCRIKVQSLSGRIEVVPAQ